MANLSASEIASAEKWLAEKVMHYHICISDRFGTEGWCTCTDDTHRDHYKEWNWHPCSDPTHAAMCREKAREKGWGYCLETYTMEPRKDISCQFFNPKLEKFAKAEAPTESLASSIALALATGWKMEEENAQH